MKYYFIILSFLLSLGLFADPPEGMSPKAQRLWNLFFESNITYSGAVELMTEHMYFRDGEDRALIEFFGHPEVAKRIKIGATRTTNRS